MQKKGLVHIQKIFGLLMRYQTFVIALQSNVWR